MRFYTSAVTVGDKIFLREINQGERKTHKVPYKPTLYHPGEGDFRTIDGRKMRPQPYDSITDARRAIKTAEDLESRFRPCGIDRWHYAFLHETYPGAIEYDAAQITTAILDIEVASDAGVPNPILADKPVTAISVMARGLLHTFGLVPHETTEEDARYHLCLDESHMLREFMSLWHEIDPDIVTGWNTERFDVPYLYYRIGNLLGKSTANFLSPWNIIPMEVRRSQRPESATGTWAGGDEGGLTLPGIASLDYMKLFKNKNLVPAPYESYSLNNIASVELGETKLDYSEYEGLFDLYRRDHDKFIRYNQRDVRLVEKLEKKRGLIAMVVSMAYRAKVNYEDVLASSRPWDAMAHSYLLDRKIVVPSGKSDNRPRLLLGGYVKKRDLKPGLYKWVASFDVTSEYPNTIIGCNISADTFLGQIPELADLASIMPIDEDEEREKRLAEWMNGLLKGKLNEYRHVALENDAIITANGCLYARSRQGFLPALLDQFFQERQAYKQIALEASRNLQGEQDPARRRELETAVSRYGTLQMGAKVALNAAYGCLSNVYYRWYNVDHAESVTSTGQLTIKWAERAINGYLSKVLDVEADYVIAIDTDSVYVNFGPLVEKVFGTSDVEHSRGIEFIDKVCREKVQPLLEEAFQELAQYLNVPCNRIEMKREVICDVAVWVAAKNYILNIYADEAVRYSDPRIKVVGIKAVKPSTPLSCRTKIAEVLKLVLRGDEKAVRSLIDDFRQKFESLSFEDLAFPRSVQNLEKYSSDVSLCASGTPIHVRGSLLYNSLILKHGIKTLSPIYDGDKIKFCYLSQPNPVMEHVIAAPEGLPRQFGLDKYIDRQTMFEKAFLNPLNDILTAMGWKVNEEASLAEFFT